MRDTLSEALFTVRLNPRPSYYAGRGARLGDLKGEQLELIFQHLQCNQGEGREYPEGAADAFVQMVASIPKLSATDFLVVLDALDRTGWKWEDHLLNAIGVSGMNLGDTKDSQGNYGAHARAVGFGAIMSVMDGMNDRDETFLIRGEFLRRRGVSPARGQGFEDAGSKVKDRDYGGYSNGCYNRAGQGEPEPLCSTCNQPFMDANEGTHGHTNDTCGRCLDMDSGHDLPSKIG